MPLDDSNCDLYRFVVDEVFTVIKSGHNDYTIDTRGDIGSWVRLEALNAYLNYWKHLVNDSERQKELYSSVIRLAAEKLDKVRFRGWQVMWEVEKTGSDNDSLR